MRNRSLVQTESQAGACRGCSLWEGRTLVFGDGYHAADLMFVGEAPGRFEDEQGKPFVGDAGQLLSKMLSEIDIQRDCVYMANVVKHRPPSNRNPYANEVKACMPWLDAQIELLDPKLIVPLGNVAMRRFRDRTDKIGAVHGDSSPWGKRTIIPTYHPSYIRRFPRMLHEYRQDFATIREALDALTDTAEKC